MGGVVVGARARHDDLMAADGTYAKLFRAQESVERWDCLVASRRAYRV